MLDLADPSWKGRWAASPSGADFQAIVGALLELKGETATAEWLKGMKACGKTTLLRLIAGFEMPDAGSIVLDGTEFAGNGEVVPPHRRGIGVVAQDGALFPHLSIGFGMPRNVDKRDEHIAELAYVVARIMLRPEEVFLEPASPEQAANPPPTWCSARSLNRSSPAQ